jgi:hypothetical protein
MVGATTGGLPLLGFGTGTGALPLLATSYCQDS